MRINPHINPHTGFNQQMNQTWWKSPQSGFRGSGNLPANQMGMINNKKNTTAINAAAFILDAEPIAGQLRDTLAQLPEYANKINAVSTNPDVLYVRSFSGNNVPETSVLIENIATTQRNEGVAMQSSAKDMPQGTYIFEVKVGGERHQISFTTDEYLTNRDFQQRMAEALNNADIGIAASVATSNGQSTLSLETATTGAGRDGQPRFSIRDITGGAVAATGVANVVQDGQDAVFYVNGEKRRTSSSNEVNLGNGLNVTLMQASEEAVSIVDGRDSAALQSGVREMVVLFNALMETAGGNSTDRFTRGLVRDLERAATSNRRSLEAVGISVSSDGMLSVDENRLREADEKGLLRDFFGGGNGRPPNGFVNRLSNISESISRNPFDHISPFAPRLPEFNNALNVLSDGEFNSGGTHPMFGGGLPNDPLSSFFDARW